MWFFVFVSDYCFVNIWLHQILKPGGSIVRSWWIHMIVDVSHYRWDIEYVWWQPPMSTKRCIVVHRIRLHASKNRQHNISFFLCVHPFSDNISFTYEKKAFYWKMFVVIWLWNIVSTFIISQSQKRPCYFYVSSAIMSFACVKYMNTFRLVSCKKWNIVLM